MSKKFFADQAKIREEEQTVLEDTAMNGVIPPRKKRITFALSISEDDIRKLKTAAAKEDIPVATYVHNWIKTIE